MFILGIHTGHDSCVVIYDDYRIIAAVPLERVTRAKSDGGFYPTLAISEALAEAGISKDQIGVIVMGRDGIFWDEDGFIKRPSATENPKWRAALFFRDNFGKRHDKDIVWHVQQSKKSAEEIFDHERFYHQYGFPRKPQLFFFNHHFAHALGALFHTDWESALIYTADGSGDDVFYSHRILKDGELRTLYGGEEDTLKGTQQMGGSVGQLYAMTTRYLGFTPLRHEGKVLGLAAHGKRHLAEGLTRRFRVDGEGRVEGRRKSRVLLRRAIKGLSERHPREDVAAAAQDTLESLILDSVGKLIERHKVRRLALSGGVFANVRLNQRLAEELPIDEIFIYPAMSDQGLAAGGVLQYLLERDGLEAWLSERQRFSHLYLGRDYDAEAESLMKKEGAICVPLASQSLAEKIAALLHEGHIVAIYRGRMEYGPRALGARSILAAPTDPRVNDWLNKRLSRTEFMPFAPVVSVERAKEIFDIKDSMLYAARFMTITCFVKEAWRDRIPAVVHVDGTARPQIIEREHNPLYYDILKQYEKRTGLPVLINTSFNAHEEPIINTPRQCAAALMAGRVDYVATPRALWKSPQS